MQLSETKQVFFQDEDSAGRKGHIFQYISIETVDAGAGGYIVISTDRWAINPDEINKFAAELRRFARRYCRED